MYAYAPPPPPPSPPKPKYRFVPCALMFLFGGISVAVGGAELHLASTNPEQVAIACDPAAVEAVRSRTWIKLPNCDLDFENAVELSRGDDIESITFPVVVPDTSPPTTLALLVTKDDEISDGLVEMRRLEALGDEVGLDALAQRLAAKLMGDALGGVTSRTAPDREVQRLLPAIPTDTLSIDHGRAPNTRLGYTSIGIGAVLVALGFGFWLHARKQTRADQEAMAAYAARFQGAPGPRGPHGPWA